MCCSREHYPATVGLHSFEDIYHHHHIILPWNLNHTVCISVDGGNVMAAWRDFDNPTRFNNYVRICPNMGWQPEEAGELSDVLSIGIAEGGVLSQAWLAEMAYKFFKGQSRWYLGERSTSWEIHPPESLEYHEWLVLQANAELRDQGIITSYEQMLRDHAKRL